MPDLEPLQILVDTDVQLPSGTTPRRVVEALRRQLQGVSVGEGAQLPSLLQTRDGQHRLPQALLLRLTETCRRQGIPFAVVDRRAMVSCPALRSRLSLDDEARAALRRLLLRDSGVLVAADARTRLALAVELVARRQQRTLLVVEPPPAVDAWVRELQAALGLGAPHVATLRQATAETRVVVGRYGAVLGLVPAVLRAEFGMVVFDGLSQVDAVSALRAVRAVGARYLLGLAAEPHRADGLQEQLFLALGGVVHEAAPPPATRPPALRLSCHFRATSFAPPYDGRAQYQALVAALARDEARARLVVEDVAREARAGHSCLVLSERRDHLEQLAALLPPELRVATLTSSVRPAERARLVERFAAGETQVLLATGQIVAEGLVARGARRLFLTFPFSYVPKLEPAIAALLQPAPGQTEALLFDYDDVGVAPLHRAFEKRRVVLERLVRRNAEEAQRRAQLSLPIG